MQTGKSPSYTEKKMGVSSYISIYFYLVRLSI
jgi:hypothetical protein